MNIHLKIEAKRIVKVSVLDLSKINTFTPSQTLLGVYEAFNINAFLLQYKVQKLSKRARRNTTIKTNAT